MGELKLYRVDDVERHYAVAPSEEEAVDCVASMMTADRQMWEEETGGKYGVSPVPGDEEHRVHMTEPGLERCEELVGRSDGLTLEREPVEGRDWENLYVSGPASAWVEALAGEAPAFVSSTVF